MSPVGHGRMTGETGAASGETRDPVTDLSDLLAATLRALGVAGRPVQASRLAARAWWLLRERWPRPAEHINGVMHFLARLPAETDDAGAGPASHTGTEDGAVTTEKE